MTNGAKDPIDRKYRLALETTYSPIPKDEFERIIDNILTLTEMGHDRKQSLNSVLEFAAKTIFRLFDFHEIGIGLKSREDGLYRYEVMFGFRKEVEENFRKIVYEYEDMVSGERFPFIRTGRLSELNPVEGLPESEEALFNRPYQLKVKRKSYDEFHEGDYIDIWMYSHNKEIIGWFEIAGPMNDKLPSRAQMRWIELIVAICSSIVVQKWAEEDASRGRPQTAPVSTKQR